VDDGSSDDTKELVEQWRTQNKVIIHYIYQENGGKHRAHNTGVKACDTELIMICDSDDYLVDDAIEKVFHTWNIVSNRTDIGGIVAYRGQFVDDKLQTSKGLFFPKDVEYTTMTELFEKSPIFETTQIYRTEVLKEYLFPEIDGEKFFPEMYCWRGIDEKYKVFVMREILEIYKYLEDGYTMSHKENVRTCPVAWSMLFWQNFKQQSFFSKKIVEYGKIRGLWMIHKDKRMPHLSIGWDIISFPIALVARKRYK
jgi:glycosyltransferase involved in cell wall biosynthesis